MALWSLNSPPKFKTDAVATPQGWCHPTTGEVLVAIRGLALKAGAADTIAALFGAASYAQGANLSAKVRFNEKVDVTAGASLVITHTRGLGDVTLYAAAGQTGVQEVLFNKQSDNTTNEVVPANVAATATITGDGTIVSADDTVNINGKIYTFKATVTAGNNVDGNVLIAADAPLTLVNLKKAINLDGVAGTDYAALTTIHPTVSAANTSATVVTLTAKTAGAGGNALTLTEGSTHLTASGGVFAGGVTNTGTMSIGAQTIGGTIVDSNSAIKASGTLTVLLQPADTETVVIDGKTYTFKTTLTNTDGFVKIGATVAESIANLVNAIILGPGAGVNYAAATTVHSTVVATQPSTTTMLVTAKTAGTAGNSLATTETLAGAGNAWGAATLAGGVAAVASTKTISAGVGSAAGTRVVA